MQLISKVKLGSNDTDEFYIIRPEMSIMEVRKLLNYIYCGVDFGDNVLEEFLDVNNNSRGVYFVPKLYNCPKMKIFIIAPNLHIARNEIS